MGDLMDYINNIDNSTLIIGSYQDRIELMQFLSDNGKFINYKFHIDNSTICSFNKNYLFYMKKHHQIEPNLAIRLKKYFDYISLSRDYDDSIIKYLQAIKYNLIKNDIIFERLNDIKRTISLNYALKPVFLKTENINYQTLKQAKNDILVIKTKDLRDQIFCVYEQTVKLLEKGIQPNQIFIVNSNQEDRLLLFRLLDDAFIPYNNKIREKISNYPLALRVKEKLNNEGYQSAKEFLRASSTSIDKDILVRLFNSFISTEVAGLEDVLVYLINNLTIKDKEIGNAINIIDYNDIVINSSNHYLFMNFYDEVFPSKLLDNDYLSDDLARLIDYPQTSKINEINRLKVSLRLNALENLVLIYPIKVVEKTIISRIILCRKTLEIDYDFFFKDQTYLSDLAILEYAKRRYDFDNYSISSKDLNLLNNTFYKNYQEYIPQFTGVNQLTLKNLVSKNNSLSGAKIETYNLCPFRYFLNYLLRIDDFQTNIFTFIGNFIHKALELRLKKPDYNLEEVFSQFDFPKEQSYKKEILFEIILENTEQIIEYINYFEAQSLFKKIYTEEKIDVPYNNSFRLSGYIDKIMVDEENHQYVIVDYKYSDKDFLMTDFETGIKMQLPFYLYTYKKQNPKYDGIGMLYQKTSSSKEQRDTQEDKRMKGIFIHVDDFIKRFDPSVSYIYGVKLKTDGTIKESKNNLLEPNSFNKIYDQVEEMISKTTKKILAGDFKISPIITKRSQLTKNSISCEYCQYSSICYSKNKLLGGDSL